MDMHEEIRLLRAAICIHMREGTELELDIDWDRGGRVIAYCKPTDSQCIESFLRSAAELEPAVSGELQALAKLEVSG